MKKIIFILFIIPCLVIGQSQSLILERKITIKVTNQSLGKVLDIISETAQFNFSYSNQVVNVKKIVSVHAENRTVKDILDQLFNQQISYQQIGNHLVLQKKIQVKKPQANVNNTPQKKYSYKISGYLRDIESGNGIPNVSIYEKNTLSISNSADFGYYFIQMTSDKPNITLKYSSETYRDTQIFVNWENQGVIDLHLSLISKFPVDNNSFNQNDSISTDTITVADSARTIVHSDTSQVQKIKLDDTKIGKWVVNNFTKILEKNIRDSFYRKWQVTFVPPIGTNGKLSSMVTNNFSFNTLLGYNGGVNGVELGGFINIIKNNVDGVQMAGFGNLVQGLVNGVQMAGFFNHNLSSVNAVQAAGFYNYNNDYTRGLMMAGFMNINAYQIDGVQLAGFMNTAYELNGLQMAGFMNTTKYVRGTQIAGFLNLAKNIKGAQIGFINIADSIDGVGIGIINLYRNGIHQLDLGYDENKLYGAAFRSGTNKFYSILSLMTQSFNFNDSSNIIAYGFGIGKRIKHNRTFYSTIDLTSHQMSYNFRTNYLHLLNQIKYSLEIKLNKSIAIYGGVSIYHSIDDTQDPLYNKAFKNFGKNTIWTHNSLTEQKIGFGYQFGLRLF